MTRKILLIASALINLISQVFIFLLHQDKSVGIEAIRELSFYILIPALLLAVVAFLNNTIAKHLLKYAGLLSLSIIIYVMAVHTGTREAASLFDHPQYLFGLISSIGVIVFNDID
jgi:amino acid permease